MKTKARILVVDDDPLVRRSCERILEKDHEVQSVENGQRGLAALAEGGVDLALVDLMLPDTSGMDILRQAPDSFPDVPIIMITGYSTIKSAVEAIKAGAFDYVAKPFTPEELAAAVEKALRQRRQMRDYRSLREVLAGRYRISQFIGQSPAMKRVLLLIEQVAQTDSTVLLTGQSGTGKELAARAIHFRSLRKDERFVAVDCGAVAGDLITSELFGHVRGAFTGAVADHDGLIQAADGGTLFLDEVGNLSADLQATLLRAVETREVRAVGSDEALEVNVRYVAATNRDLQALVEQGKFREDLFYRLNVFPINLPALRERREDIPLLARHFLALFSAKMHKRVEGFTPEAMDALVQYDWPGNVRELSNVVERLTILAGGGRIGRARLRESMAVSPAPTSVARTADELNELRKTLRDQAVVEAEKAFLLEALRCSDYNVTRAAEQAGMQRSNFQALLRKHGLRIRDLVDRRE